MKIIISTIVDYNNYGNRLQNFALQKIIEDLGHEVETLRNYTNKEKPFIQKLSNTIKEGGLFDKINKKIFNVNVNSSLDNQRKKAFEEFTYNNINETLNSINQNTTDFSFLDNTDCFIIGSDQVWNYNFSRFSELDFISFSKKPKISYAASFGVSAIPKKWEFLYKKGLNQIDYISVREDAGKKIIEKLVNKDATIVLDPTMLLKRAQWEEVIEAMPKYKEKFVLSYFLEEPLNKNQLYISEYAKRNNLSIKKLGTRDDTKLWCADPAEFINLFSQADAVFTDSFHACVFAIIFEKYFEVFDRNTKMESMNSRIDTLLNDLKITDRWNRTNERPTNNINYEKVKNLLEERRKDSLAFLKHSIEQIDKEK